MITSVVKDKLIDVAKSLFVISLSKLPYHITEQ
jgi:hypothetical protein